MAFLVDRTFYNAENEGTMASAAKELNFYFHLILII